MAGRPRGGIFSTLINGAARGGSQNNPAQALDRRILTMRGMGAQSG